MALDHLQQESPNYKPQATSSPLEVPFSLPAPLMFCVLILSKQHRERNVEMKVPQFFQWGEVCKPAEGCWTRKGKHLKNLITWINAPSPKEILSELTQEEKVS